MEMVEIYAYARYTKVLCLFIWSVYFDFLAYSWFSSGRKYLSYMTSVIIVVFIVDLDIIIVDYHKPILAWYENRDSEIHEDGTSDVYASL